MIRTGTDPTRDHEALERLAEFDHPFRVAGDGTLESVPYGAGIYAPEVMHADMPGNELDGLGDWEPLSGHSGQVRYDGPVMHASETLSGGLAADVLATPGVYVVVAVECYPESLWPHEWSPSGARCTRTGCNVVGTGDPDDNPCTMHPEYDAQADDEGQGWSYPEPAGWAVLKLREVTT